jgi:hypothetical protein
MCSKNRLLALACTFVLALILIPSAAGAAAPSNDNFAAAAPLKLGEVVSGDNLDATSEANEPDPFDDGKADACQTLTESPSCTSSVWYRLTVLTSGDYTVNTCDLGTDFDTVLDVYEGPTLVTLINDDGNDDACDGAEQGHSSSVTFHADAGVVYHVQLMGFDAARGSFYIRAFPAASPPPPQLPDTRIELGGSFPAHAIGTESDTKSGPRHSASFAFGSNALGAKFECSLDGAAFSACASPASFDVADGDHTFAVRALSGGQADGTPALQRFAVDRTPPETFLRLGPTGSTGPSTIFKSGESELNFHNQPFLCGVDAEPLQSCDNIRSVGGWCNGRHEFRSAAVDRAANVDPEPLIVTPLVTGVEGCSAPTIDSVSEDSISATAASIRVIVNAHGSGGSFVVDYGKTAAYGAKTSPESVDPNIAGGSDGATLLFLDPATVYHYRVTYTTSAGVTQTADRTFTTHALGGGKLPTASVGTPVVVGRHAAAIPLTIDSRGANAGYSLLVNDSGPVDPDSPPIFIEDEVPAVPAGPQSRTVDLVDLDPGKTYHVRAAVSGDEETLSNEVTFTMPDGSAAAPAAGSAAPPPLPPVKRFHFALKRSSISLGKISRKSKVLTITIRNLPSGAAVSAKLSAGARASAVKQLAKARARAGAGGVATLKLKLSKQARKALRNRHLKAVSIAVTVQPKGDSASRVTLRRKLAR